MKSLIRSQLNVYTQQYTQFLPVMIQLMVHSDLPDVPRSTVIQCYGNDSHNS